MDNGQERVSHACVCHHCHAHLHTSGKTYTMYKKFSAYVQEEPKWEMPTVDEREVSERERDTLRILREQRGTSIPINHR